MAKFFGMVGFANTEETTPGVWTGVQERPYAGEVREKRSGWQDAESTNDDITINKTISIVADPYAYNNFSTIRYVKYMGAAWKVTNISVEYPRLVLTVGGLYNGQTLESS